MRGALLLVVACVLASARVAVIVNLGTVTENTTERLYSAFEAHLFSSEPSCDISLYNGMGEWILTWTPCSSRDLIRLALASIIASKSAPEHWAPGLVSAATHTPDATIVYVIADKSAQDGIAAAAVAHTLTRVVPIGVGSDVSVESLVQVASPCNAVLGCLRNWNYFVVSSMRSIVRALDPSVTMSPTTTTSATTTSATTSATTTSAAPAFVRVIGHVYLGGVSADVENRRRVSVAAGIVARGYAGVRVTLRDENGARHLAVTSPMGEFDFPRVPTGVATLDYDIPPGFVLVAPPTSQLTLVNGGINRVPPVEMQFDEKHRKAATDESRETEPLSSNDWVIVGFGIAIGVIIIVLLIVWACFYYGHAKKRTDESEMTLMQSVQPRIVSMPGIVPERRQRHGLKAKLG